MTCTEHTGFVYEPTGICAASMVGCGCQDLLWVSHLKSTPALLTTKLTSRAPIGDFLSSEATTSSSPAGREGFASGVGASDVCIHRNLAELQDSEQRIPG